MCSLKTSNTRPSRDKSSSVAKTGSIHSFWVTSYKASRRLDAVSSGPKTRKFRDFQVFRLLQVGYRYLVGAPSTFDRLAIHKFRSGPSLGAAQNDHRPERKGSRSLGASFILNGVDFFDNHIEGGRHELVHRFRLVPFHHVRFVSITAKKAGQLLVGEATKHSRIRDLVAIQVKNGKHRSIARRIEKLVRMPARGEWTRLRLAVTNHATGQQVRIVED